MHHKNFEEFDKIECQKILDVVLKNKKHSDKVKTLSFLSSVLKKIPQSEIHEILGIAEEYYYYIAHFFSLSKDEKLLFVASKIKEFKDSDLECCHTLFEPDSFDAILSHTLSLDHFLNKNNVNMKFHRDVEKIVDYFKATKNLNKNELILLNKLIQENKQFNRLVLKNKGN